MEAEETKSPATVEEHAKAAGTPAWLFAAARAYHRWAIGAELSAEEFQKAITTTLAEPYGYGIKTKG